VGTPLATGKSLLLISNRPIHDVKKPRPIVSGLFFEFNQVEPSAAFTEFSLEMHATRQGRETFSIPVTWSGMMSLKWPRSGTRYE
jgi:hypothetical protein